MCYCKLNDDDDDDKLQENLIVI